MSLLSTRWTERDDCGTVSLVIVLPVFFLAVLIAVEFALWSHAAAIARNAANQGATAAAAFGSTPAEARRSAVAFIDATGKAALAHPAIRVAATANTVSVTVSGRPQMIIPWIDPQVSSTSVQEVQRFHATG
jgi:Flp pilus assembly protein TadG